MKYIGGLSMLTACGVLATNTDDTGGESADELSLRETEKISTEENRGETELAQSHTFNPPALGGVNVTPSPIPALILPNNICVINTDLSPDRTIEEHILACVEAQRIRNTITR